MVAGSLHGTARLRFGFHESHILGSNVIRERHKRTDMAAQQTYRITAVRELERQKHASAYFVMFEPN
jgi:hypothetical protein